MGATRGYIYLRSEYPPRPSAPLRTAIERARAAGYLGDNVMGSGRAFELEVRLGAGAYICGEETSMLESLEGKRGVVRAKPPLPAISGLFGQPTVINNVMSFASVPIILARGAAFYRDYGMGRSRGTLPFQLAGNLKRPGLVEKAFGVTLRELLVDYGGGLRPAAGRCAPPRWAGRWAPTCPESQFRRSADYEAVHRHRRHGGPRRHRGLRRARRHGEAGALRPWSSVPRSPAANAPPAASAPPAAWRSSTASSVARRRGRNVGLLNSLCDTMLNGSLCAWAA